MTQESIMLLLSLEDSICALVKNHLKTVGLEYATDVHKMVLEQLEPALLRAVIEHCQHNKTKAAQLLGLSRKTLRTMLLKYFDSKYFGQSKTEDNQ